MSYLVFDLADLAGVTLADGTLMVTKDSDISVGAVVGEQLLSDGAVLGCLLFQLILECERRVVGTEHLGRQSLHQVLQMLVQL